MIKEQDTTHMALKHTYKKRNSLLLYQDAIPQLSS